MTLSVEVRHVARLVTLCGCTREMGVQVPMPPSIVIALRADPTVNIFLDDASLHVLLEDEAFERRTFERDHIERPNPGLIVGVYHERKETKRRAR